MTKTFGSLTEQEERQAETAMLKAALEALGKFPGELDEEDQDEFARRVVNALAAAQRSKNAEEKRLEQMKGCSLHLATTPSSAVATAFWMWSERIELDLSEVSAYSNAGARWLGFAQGMAAARAMTEALDLLTDGSMFAFCGSGAEKLAPDQ